MIKTYKEDYICRWIDDTPILRGPLVRLVVVIVVVVDGVMTHESLVQLGLDIAPSEDINTQDTDTPHLMD